MLLSLLALGAAGAAGVAAQAMEPIEMKGSKLFYKNGTQFFIKGVAYQQDTSASGGTNDKTTKFIDPLSDKDRCRRDVPLLAQLGTNTIRTYAIDPNADHKDCMEMLQKEGIYVIADLGEPALSINRDEPQWNTELFDRYRKVVDELGQYPNVIGFFAGNEVSNNKTNTGASAYVKAAVRDTKAYIKSKGGRWMGVGYAANDDVDIRKQIADYFNCGKAEDAIDFWGYNIYSWCGKSDMQKSGFSKQVDFFRGYSVPVFFAEYGCNIPGGAAKRIFDETTALYSDKMTGVFSGGIVYMYFQEDNDYGLVKINGNQAEKLDDFEKLQEKVTAARPKGIERDSYNPTNKPQQCPDSKTANWRAHEALPPTPDQSLCDCMSKSRSCVRKQGLSPKSFGDMFGFICGAAPEICTGIQGNASTGVYGAYSMCPDGAKLDYVLDAYYSKLNKAADACDFKGQAVVQKGAADASCGDKLAKASDVNRQAATATAPVASATGDSMGVPGAPVARLSVGGLAVGLYMAVAVVAGAAVVVAL